MNLIYFTMSKKLKLNGLKIGKAILIIAVIFLIVALAIYPDKYSKSTYEGVLLWAVSVMPSLLPYFFLTAILSKIGALSSLFKKLTPLTNKVFRLSGISAYCFLMSILSGYPVGSKLTADFYECKLIEKGEAKRLSLLCSTSGPLFIIGAVGATMFQDKTVGFIIYVTHILSAIITAIIFRNFFEPPIDRQFSLLVDKCDNALYDSVYSSVISVLIVGGFVSVFYVISEILCDFNILLPLSYIIELILSPFNLQGIGNAISFGFIEFTKGAKALSSLGATPLTISLANFIITFGGLSVIMQSLAFLKKAQVNAWFFILGKFIQALISSISCYFICLVFL